MKHSEVPGVVAPPPIIFFGLEGVGLLIHWLAPIPFLPAGLTWIAGLPLVAIGFGLGLTAFATLRRAGTPVDPYEPSTAIVTDGPYRFTRNPIYVGFTLIYLGFACLFNSLWPLALLPVVLVIVDRLVIAREERYLETKFGAEYARYKTTVRRWV